MNQLRNLATAAAIMAALPAVAQTELIYNSYLPPFNETFQVGIRDFAAAIEEESGGAITVTIPDSSMAPGNRQYEMVRDGIADMAVVATSSVAQYVVLNEIGELPGMAPTAEAGSVALWETFNESFAEKGEWQGVKVFSTHVLPGRDILSVGELRVSMPGDLQGKRLWATTRAFVETSEAVGGVPLDTEFPELQEFVARGDLDGLFISPGSADGAGVLEQVQQIARLPGGFGTVSFAVIMNQDIWDGLSDEEKGSIERAADGLARRLGKAQDDSEAEVADIVAGIETNVITGDGLAAFEEVLSPQVEAWKARAVEAGLEDPQAAIEFYKSVLAREVGN